MKTESLREWIRYVREHMKDDQMIEANGRRTLLGWLEEWIDKQPADNPLPVDNLREKLEETQTILSEQYGAMGPDTDAREYAHVSARLEQVTEIIMWLDTLPDGWHDLREKPEDLPETHGNVWLCYQYRGNFYGQEAFCDTELNWCDTEAEDLNKEMIVIGWHALPTIPARFKITPEEISQHKDPMMGQL